MKYLEIDLTPVTGNNLEYPAGYQSEIGDFAKDHLYYDDSLGAPKLVLCIEDADYKTSMIRPRVKAITEAEAIAISEAHEQRTEIITDEAKVRRIEIQSRLGMTLSTEDMDAIDPKKAGSCFSTTKILADRLSTIKGIETAKALAKANEHSPIG